MKKRKKQSPTSAKEGNKHQSWNLKKKKTTKKKNKERKKEKKKISIELWAGVLKRKINLLARLTKKERENIQINN